MRVIATVGSRDEMLPHVCIPSWTNREATRKILARVVLIVDAMACVTSHRVSRFRTSHSTSHCGIRRHLHRIDFLLSDTRHFSLHSSDVRLTELVVTRSACKMLLQKGPSQGICFRVSELACMNPWKNGVLVIWVISFNWRPLYNDFPDQCEAPMPNFRRDSSRQLQRPIVLIRYINLCLPVWPSDRCISTEPQSHIQLLV
jgi:hypothetical protein